MACRTKTHTIRYAFLESYVWMENLELRLFYITWDFYSKKKPPSVNHTGQDELEDTPLTRATACEPDNIHLLLQSTFSHTLTLTHTHLRTITGRRRYETLCCEAIEHEEAKDRVECSHGARASEGTIKGWLNGVFKRVQSALWYLEIIHNVGKIANLAQSTDKVMVNKW